MEPKVQFPQLQKYEGVMPSILTRDGLVSFPQKGKKKYPSGAVLHWDADIDAFSEQTGNHQYLSSILGPQYVRQADGTPVSIGAAAPVDTFEDGFVGLRSCGQVQNNVWNSIFEGAGIGASPSGRIASTTTSNGIARSIVGFGPGYIDVRFSGTCVGSTAWVNVPMTSLAYPVAALSETWTGSAKVTLLSGGWSAVSPRVEVQEATSAGASLASSSTTLIGRSGQLTPHTRTFTNASVGKCNVIPFAISVPVGTTVDFTVRIEQPQLTKTAYPQPYVPTTPAGPVTQPASNATATGGSWFSIPVGSPVYNALRGGPMTLASVVRMGVGSADLPTSTTINILACDDVATSLLRYAKGPGGATYLQLFDVANMAVVACAVSRYDRIQVAVQVLANGTQMRIGYRNLTAGQTTITWGDATAYRGMFGPDSTLQRLMAGYGNAYPFWVEKLTTIPEAVSDARIMEAAA